MSTQAGYTIEGLPERNERRRPRSGGANPVFLILAALTLLLVGVNVALWLLGSSRSSAAVRKVVTDAQAYRENWKSREAAAAQAKSGGRKKGKKPAAAKAAPAGVAGVAAPLPDGPVPLDELTAANEKMERELAAFHPDGVYIVIDTANNRLLMKKGEETLLDAVCSTGSYSKLDAPDGRSWFFHTPRGSFKMLSKKQDPVWVKPDWAFVEEQEAIPGARHPDRYEPYVMGDYAMGFGNGYYIHGTLYRRLLGQSVTHGCVRLGDEELETVYRTAPLGTPIYIY